MNNTMLGLLNLSGGEIILILAANMAVVVGGILVLVVFLTRKGRHGTPAVPVRPPPPPAPPAPACPRCGASLPTGAPQGLCPRCVLGVGLATHTDGPGESGPHGTRVAQPPLAPADIARHFPQLEILECLGRGGMGVVYKARQPKLNRLVALKILAPEKGADPRFAERFQREAQALARLSHPNIVTVHDFGEADGLYYLLMEYVDGVTLRQLLQARKIAPEEALAIVPKICEALQFAHELGVVHRDIKPENVLLDKQGAVKIADFGIAKLVGGTPLTPSEGEPVSGRAGEGTLTQDQVLGTPHYMAPEQVETPQLVDHRADIFSLGVVFYEMLTGELPLGKFSPPSHRVKMDVRLDEVVLHALEKEPERRYQQASQVKTDVETIARSEGGSGKSELERARVAPPLAAGGAESAWEQVKAPATGLVVAAIFNWVAIPITCLLVMFLMKRGPWGMFHRLAPLLLVPLGFLVLSSVTLVAGLMMKRLAAYGLAVTGALLAILVIPGNLIGLPIGIWALAVLSRREVRQAFGKGLPMPQRGPGQPGRSGGAWKVVAVVVTAVLLVLAVPVGALLLAIALPAFSKARDRARIFQQQIDNQANPVPQPQFVQPSPTFVVHGTVTDAATGRPIPGAQVHDNVPNSHSDQPAELAITDANGHYELRTWFEDHTLAASAPGYETELYLFRTKPDYGTSGQTNSPRTPVPSEKLTAYISATIWLEELKRRDSELLLRHTESHPLVRDVRGQIEKLTRQKADLEKQYPALALRLDDPEHRGTDAAAPQVLTARVAALGIVLSNVQAQASHAMPSSEEATRSFQRQIANLQDALLDAQRALVERRAKLDDQLRWVGRTNSAEMLVPADKLIAYSSTTTKLEELDRRQTELLLQYTEDHPVVRTVRDQKEKLARQKADLEQQYPVLAFRLDSPGNVSPGPVSLPPGQPAQIDFRLRPASAGEPAVSGP